MGAQLNSTVHVKDPETHLPVILQPGTCPEPRLAALVTNPSAWVDGKLPRLPKATEGSSGSGDGSPSGSGPDAASGDASGTSETADTQPEPDQGNASGDTKPAARKTAARKTAATKPAAH